MVARVEAGANERELLTEPVDDSVLQRMVGRITDRVPDACVVLFGSRAYGQSRPASDVDLLVVPQDGRGRFALAGELYMRLRPRTFPLDLVVISRDDMRQRLRGFDPFLEEVTTKGRVLHGRLN